MLVAGVDGGATSTKTVVLDVDSGSVWVGQSGPSNPINVGVVSAGTNIRQALEDAVKRTGYKVSDIALIVAGLAGLDSRIVYRHLAPHIVASSGLGGKLHLEHDAHIAWLYATRGGEGVLVVAGTGSIAYSAYRGKRFIAGNRGWLLGDEGSGFWVARKALRRLLRAFDGRSSHDCLTRSLKARLGVSDSDELMYWFYLTRGRIESIAAVAKHVVDAAEEGCDAAKELLQEGAQLLAEAAIVVAERTSSRTVYIIGGMFNSRVFLEAFSRTVKAAGLQVRETIVYAVLGALYLALRRVGFRDKEAWQIVDSPNVTEAAKRLYTA
jgi:N-acetylglucosamine kinase-like BadF-type ATPase